MTIHELYPILLIHITINIMLHIFNYLNNTQKLEYELIHIHTNTHTYIYIHTHTHIYICVCVYLNSSTRQVVVACFTPDIQSFHHFSFDSAKLFFVNFCWLFDKSWFTFMCSFTLSAISLLSILQRTLAKACSWLLYEDRFFWKVVNYCLHKHFCNK